MPEDTAPQGMPTGMQHEDGLTATPAGALTAKAVATSKAALAARLPKRLPSFQQRLGDRAKPVPYKQPVGQDIPGVGSEEAAVELLAGESAIPGPDAMHRMS